MPQPETIQRNSTPKRIAFLDFARGFAILTIVLFHEFSLIASEPLATIVGFGAAGVHAFVFLSGFGLTLATLRTSLHGFYVRRLRRVILPYFAFVTILFVLNQWWVIYPGQGWREYLGHILFFKMFDESIIGSFGYHLWFLSTLLQLYWIFPVLFHGLCHYGGRRLLFATCAISVVFTQFVILTGRSELRVYNSCGLVYLWEFALGMYAASVYQERSVRFWEWPIQRLWLGTAISLLLLAAMQRIPEPSRDLLNNPAALFAYGGVLLLVYRVAAKSAGHLFELALCRLSVISYELYLVHGVVVTRLFWYMKPASTLERIVYLALAFGVAILTAGVLHSALSVVIENVTGRFQRVRDVYH